jgi:hypothetical protein
MGYKAIITLDLAYATDKQRESFYEYLIKKNWYKISSLTTAWRASFGDTVTRVDAIQALEKELSEAKIESKVSKVEYALQLDKFDVVVKTI